MGKSVNRREFVLAAGGAILAAGCRSSSIVDSPPDNPSRLVIRIGETRRKPDTGIKPLGFGAGRDGFLYVPPGYSPSKPASLLVLFHGAGHSSAEWAAAPLDTLFGSRNIVVLAPDSRATTWDVILQGFGDDVAFINKALAYTFDRVVIDPKHISVGGFSDGATYALSLGLVNGDLLDALVAFSPGFVWPGEFLGKPRIFMSHGITDSILPIEIASRQIVPVLRHDGYDVYYIEFNGGHEIPADVETKAAEWVATGVKT